MAEVFSTGDVNLQAEATRTGYANGILALFGNTKAATANDAEGASPLILITVDSGAFEAGVATNGLNFDAAVDGLLSKAAAETWSGVGLAAAGTGTVATWYRYYANDYTTGASTTALRFDGTISTSSTAELQMINQTVVEGETVVVRTFTRRVKRSA